MELWKAVVSVLVNEPDLYISDRICRVAELVYESAGAAPRNGEEIFRMLSLYTSSFSPCWRCGRRDRRIGFLAPSASFPAQYLHESCSPVKVSEPVPA